MDVFHKVLTRIYEISGGRESQEVDLIELLKQEGFYANRDSIKDHLSTEGWITDAPRPNHIRITHWGMAEAKKAVVDPKDAGPNIERHTTRLLAVSRDFSIVIGEFVAKPDKKTIKAVEDRFSEIENLLSTIKGQL